MADNKLLARIARKHGARLLDAVIDRLLPIATADSAAQAAEPSPKGQRAAKRAATSKPAKSGSLTTGIVGAVVTRVALRSVPGAILVGGGILARRLHARRKAQKASQLAAAHDTDLLSPEKGD